MGKPVKQQNSFLKKLLTTRSFSILVVLIALLIIFTVFSPGGNFINAENIKVLLAYGSEFSIIALGVGVLMIAGEFDLSIGSILVFCSYLFLIFFKLNLNYFVVLALTILGVLPLAISMPSHNQRSYSILYNYLRNHDVMEGLTLWFSGGLQQACDVSSSSAFLSF